MVHLFRTLLLAGILLPILSPAQDTTKVILPYEVAVQVFAELKEKDNWKVILDKQDSLITVYKQKNETQKRIISTFKLQQEDYESVIDSYKSMVAVQETAFLDFKYKSRKNLRSVILAAFVELIIIIILI